MVAMVDTLFCPYSAPLARFRLVCWMAWRRSARVRPMAASFSGCACTRIAGRSCPVMLIRPTPSIWLSWRASRVSA
ncbi:hypothetical protein D3C80_1497810 [compost metagenome]